MKISCVLTSFNRPNWVRDALQSIANQTHEDIQLIVVDESDEFLITDVLKDFDFPGLIVRHIDRTPMQRSQINCLSDNCNKGLELATGDLVCFLADDDYYYPTWFSAAAAYFKENPLVQVGFGKLVYSYSPVMAFSPNPDPSVIRFYIDPLKDPFGKLDHNQVIHRRFDRPYPWPLGVSTIGGPDAHYFQNIARDYLFHPIPAFAAVKRIHRKGLMESQQIYLGGGMEGLRE